MSANPVLHWPLDSITRDNTVIDTTENHLNASLEGNPQNTPDEKFGSCVVFGGQADSFVLEDSPPIRVQTYTVELWINPNQPSTWVGVIGKPGRNYCMFLHPDGYVHHRFATPTNSNDGFNTSRGSIRWKVWQHVAITNDGHTARTYIDGKLAGEYSFTGELVVSQKPLIVGRDLDGVTKQYYYGGRMAHVRLYDAPLSALEIQHDMAEDEAALAAFVRTYPIDFNLYNQDQHHVLYIDDNPAGQEMTLQLTNTSRQDLVLPDIGQNVSAQDYHFALGFRPQTVAQTPQPSLATEDGDWVFGRTPDNTSFYLLHKGEMRLPAGQSTGLTLRGMNADGRSGTRGTRVELLYQHLKYSGGEEELRGSRLQYLDVVNHRGLREIPLHAGFIGGNTVLSDGSTTSPPLRLRIANTSRDATIRLNAGDATTPASSFVVSLDVQQAGETREWALIGSGTADDVELKVSGAGKWADPVKSDLGQSIQWTITPQENVELGPNGSLILTLENVIALQSLGHANIYVNYRNIPGYQDGLFVVGVEKSPLLFWQKNITDTATIGVGLQQPTQTLDVNGNIRQRGFDFYVGLGDGGRGDTGYSRALVKDRDSRLTINYASDFKGGVNIRGPEISLDGNVAIGAIEASAKANAKIQVINQAQDANGSTLILGPINAANLRLGYHTDYSWIQSHGAKPLAINQLGNNVGIGLPNPGYRLHVAGTAYADELFVGSGDHSFTRVIFGHTVLGSHSGGVKKIPISFPQAFRHRPFVVATVRSENADYSDTFACTVRYLDTTRFEVNILRLDSHGAGWSQNVRLHWMAWETTYDSDS